MEHEARLLMRAAASTAGEAVRLVEASRHYGSGDFLVRALDSVTHVFESGTFTCLMGPSGCGKTTLLNLVAGLDVPTTGEIHVGDVRVDQLDEAARARLRATQLGMVFQDNALVPEFTVLENVMLPLEVQGLARAKCEEAARASLERVGIGALSSRRLHEISGGQAQRAGIARALTGQRKVLLADEPTGALDSDNSHQLFALLRQLASDGTCVIMCTHDSDATAYADVVLRMRDGALVAGGV